MIDVYKEIAQVLGAINGLAWVDIAPRLENNTAAYPAAYLCMDELKPLNMLGSNDHTVSATFSVEYWLKPFDTSGTEPQHPALTDLASYFKIVEDARKALLSFQGKHVYNTTLLSEKTETEQKGYYIVRQQWTCNSYLWNTELLPIPNDIPIVIEIE